MDAVSRLEPRVDKIKDFWRGSRVWQRIYSWKLGRKQVFSLPLKPERFFSFLFKQKYRNCLGHFYFKVDNKNPQQINEYGVSVWDDKNILEEWWWWWHNIVNILHAELHTKMVNCTLYIFTTIIKKKGTISCSCELPAHLGNLFWNIFYLSSNYFGHHCV